MTTYYTKPKTPADAYHKFNNYKNTVTKYIKNKDVETTNSNEKTNTTKIY